MITTYSGAGATVGAERPLVFGFGDFAAVIPLGSQRGNIDYDQIRSGARSGVGTKLQTLGVAGFATGQLPQWDAAGDLVPSGTTPGGGGTVLSVSATVPSRETVTVTNPTTTPAIAITDNNQSANTVFAGPSSGGAAAPTFRAVVPADLPLGSSLAFGAVKVDGTTIAATAGVISAVNAGNVALYVGGTLVVSSFFTSPLTTLGDIVIAGASGVANRLGIGTTGQVLTVVAGSPAWAATQPSTLPLPPSLGSFAWVNQGSSTTSNNGGMILATIADSSSLNWRILQKSPAFSTPYSVAAFWKSYQYYTNSQDTGLYFYDGTKLMGIEILSQGSGSVTLRVERITNVNTDNATQFSVSLSSVLVISNPLTGGFYGRLRNNGSTLFFDYSLDGYNWINLYSESVGTFITPTAVGFGGISVTAGTRANCAINLQGWLETNVATL